MFAKAVCRQFFHMICIISSHRRQKEFDVWGLSGIQSKISAHLEEIWTPDAFDAFLLVFYLFLLSAFPLRNLANLYHFSVCPPPPYKVGFFFCKKIEMRKAI